MGAGVPMRYAMWGLCLCVCMLTAAAANGDATAASSTTLTNEPEEWSSAATRELWDEVVANVTARMDGIEAEVADVEKTLSTVWVFVCGCLVFLMQVGFCFLEAGTVRSSNVINIIFKNMGDCSIGALMWWAVGYSLAFGTKGNAVMGYDTAYMALSPGLGDELSDKYAHFWLSFTYMTTAATIISGAVAERINLIAYAVVVLLVTSVGYPTSCRWIWGDGFLSPWSENVIAGNGALDFAGSIVIHLFGGVCGVTLAWAIGPRKLRDGIDVFSPAGQIVITPHNKLQQAVGTLILWFCWYAFNAGSVGAMSGGGSRVAAQAVLTTCISSGISTVVGGLVSRYRSGFYDIGDTCNCALSGLVGITAGCAYVSTGMAAFIGVVSVFTYFGFQSLRRRLRIDDVVDAGAVHLAGGVWGGISVGLCADQTRIEAALGMEPGSVEHYGLFYGGGWTLLGNQVFAVAAVTIWAVLFCALAYTLLQPTIGMRVSEEHELAGLDISEHRANSYDYIERLQRERQLAFEAVQMVEAVTAAMARFDTDAAEKALTKRSDLEQKTEQESLQDGFTRLSPESSDGEALIAKEDSKHVLDADASKKAAATKQQGWYLHEIREVLASMLGHLKLYRPHLPNSLFVPVEDEAAPVATPDGERAVLVFVDIEKSTELWESDPVAMRAAVALYEKVIREHIQSQQGYEVKLIGSAFMIAFPDYGKAIRFMLEAQEVLYNTAWPSGMLTSDMCGAAVAGKWNGPRVRMGCHGGGLVQETNPVTSRDDYLGESAAVAAMLCEDGVGGGICVTGEVFEKLSCIDPELQLIGAPAVYKRQNVELSAVPGRHTLYVLTPKALAGRQDEYDTLFAAERRANAYVQPGARMAHVEDRASLASAAELSLLGGASALPNRVSLELKAGAEKVVGTAGAVNFTYANNVLIAPLEAASALNKLAAKVLVAAERTDGCVSSMTGRMITLSWNTAKACPLHVANAMRFAQLLGRQSGYEEPLPLNVGLCSGAFVFGNVGGLVKFSTALGNVVSTAQELAIVAARVPTHALYTYRVGSGAPTDDPSLPKLTQEIDIDASVWSENSVFNTQSPTSGGRPSKVYSVGLLVP